MNTNGSIIACIWDFDKTLISGYMQAPLFREYGIDEHIFWEEIDRLPSKYRDEGIRLSDTLSYLNYILELVKLGRLPGLSRRKLMAYGQQLTFCYGIPELFQSLKNSIEDDIQYQMHGITVEHYIISSGHAEIIRGSKVLPFVDGIFACEFLGNEIENEVRIFFERQRKESVSIEKGNDFSEGYSKIYDHVNEIAFDHFDNDRSEIKQIACVIDQTQKTRCLFEINKGTNKNAMIDINATIGSRNRRIPFQNMIYIADGPSDIPAFSVVRRYGGQAFAVYDPHCEREFEQNDRMLQDGRIDAYGPSDYRLESSTAKWILMHVQKIAQRIVDERELLVENSMDKVQEYLY